MQSIEDFIEKYKSCEMLFKSYYKYRFTYEFKDHPDVYEIVCGDTTGDIYRDNWKSAEVIGELTPGFVHHIRKIL